MSENLKTNNQNSGLVAKNQQPTFTLVADGTYEAWITDVVADMGTNPKTGKPQKRFKFYVS